MSYIEALVDRGVLTDIVLPAVSPLLCIPLAIEIPLSLYIPFWLALRLRHLPSVSPPN